jgi:plastocyanin
MRRPSAVLAALAALALSGALAVSAFGATKTVAVKDDVFAPKSITVKKGTTVKWTWHGSQPHNVTVTSGPAKFHSATQKRGSYSKKLTKKGTYKIVCTIHAPGMSMKVKVN